MFYVKFEDLYAEVKVDITDENVFTTCPVCGKEHAIDIVECASHGDFDLFGTSIFCLECAEEHQAKECRTKDGKPCEEAHYGHQ